MSWGQLFQQLIEQLRERLTGLTSDGEKVFQAVYVGRLQAPSAFPCVYILPQRVRQTPATVRMSTYEMNINIRVITREVGSAEAVSTSTKLVGLIESMLIADRTFGGLIHNLEVDDIVYNVERPIQRDRQETELRVRFIVTM